jgi:hypothetical protein
MAMWSTNHDGIQRGSLVSFSPLAHIAPKRKENTKKREVGDVDLRIKFSDAPPWLCADARSDGAQRESRADVGLLQENHES